MRSRSSTRGRTPAARPEAAAALLVLLAAGCLDASPGAGADAASEPYDAGGPVHDGGDAIDGAPVDATPGAGAALRCPRSTQAAPVIDGTTEDSIWADAGDAVTFDPDGSKLKFEVDEYQDDSFVTAKCLHTDATLYLFFEVFDGVGAANGAIEVGDPDVKLNDALVLFFDGLGDRAGTYGDDDHWLAVDAADKTLAPDGDTLDVVLDADPEPDSIWRLEVAVDIDSLAPGPVATSLIGFDFALHDDDGFGDSVPELIAFWAAEEGACFDCCAGEPDPYCDTSQFATLALEP